VSIFCLPTVYSQSILKKTQVNLETLQSTAMSFQKAKKKKAMITSVVRKMSLLEMTIKLTIWLVKKQSKERALLMKSSARLEKVPLSLQRSPLRPRLSLRLRLRLTPPLNEFLHKMMSSFPQLTKIPIRLQTRKRLRPLIPELEALDLYSSYSSY
jgi:hypothetical protein